MMAVAGVHTVSGQEDHQLGPRAYIEAHRRRRHSNRVLHGHPSPLLWRSRDLSVPEIMAARAEALRATPCRLNLYVATPYCLPTNPDRCGFCLFPSEVYQGRSQLGDYLGTPRWERGRSRSGRSEEHTSELQSPCNLVCRLLLEKKNTA